MILCAAIAINAWQSYLSSAMWSGDAVVGTLAECLRSSTCYIQMDLPQHAIAPGYHLGYADEWPLVGGTDKQELGRARRTMLRERLLHTSDSLCEPTIRRTAVRTPDSYIVVLARS